MNSYLLTFISIGLVAATYIFQYKIDHGDLSPKHKKNFAIFAYIISFGLLLIAGLAQVKIEEANRIIEAETQRKLDTITLENRQLKLSSETNQDSLQNKIRQLNDTLKNEGKKIETLYMNLISKNEFIQNSLFGSGNAIVKRGPTIVDSNYNYRTAFYIENTSEYPIYNFNVKIYDYTKLDRSRLKFYTDKSVWSVNAKEYEESILFSIGPIDLNPREFFRSNFFSEPRVAQLNVAVITARNTMYYEKLVQYYDDELRSIFDAIQVYDSEFNLISTDYQLKDYIWEDEMRSRLDIQFAQINLKEFAQIKIYNERSYDD